MNKKLALLTSAAFGLALTLSSCSSDHCTTCKCTGTETETVTMGGTSNTESTTLREDFTARSGDVNNSNVPSLEYWESNPVTVQEESFYFRRSGGYCFDINFIRL